LFIQLDFPPYSWKDKAVKAFEQYINEGRGGWIGFHHATLLGEFDGFPDVALVPSIYGAGKV
jgi:hypothetical protein